MAEPQGTFRCYYDDGTILTQPVCPLTNSNGSPLVNAEYTIIDNVNEHISPWWLLLILLMLAAVSKERKG